MDRLISGTIEGFTADTLAGRMDEAFVQIWNARKPDQALPNDQQSIDDRRMLFVAVAQGMLRYLHDHQDDIATTEDTAGGILNSEHDHQLFFDWATGE